MTPKSAAGLVKLGFGWILGVSPVVVCAQWARRWVAQLAAVLGMASLAAALTRAK